MKRILSRFWPKTPQAIHHVTKGNHIENLAGHRQVDLQPIGKFGESIKLPIWYDFTPAESNPATYENVFWEIEPMGEYLFFLAGDFKKNEKGLLRFRSAPLEIRAERTFETDTISVAFIDSAREQQQAEITAADVSDISKLTVSDIASIFVPKAQELGDERWVICNRSRSVDLNQGISRLAVGFHFATGKPYIEIIDERFYQKNQNSPHQSLFKVVTWSEQLDLPISEALNLHNNIAQKYDNMPYVPLSGAIRM
ncbi:MAG: hypothetical protein ACPGVJ_08435 [Mangrovicoccus sp.]